MSQTETVDEHPGMVEITIASALYSDGSPAGFIITRRLLDVVEAVYAGDIAYGYSHVTLSSLWVPDTRSTKEIVDWVDANLEVIARRQIGHVVRKYDRSITVNERLNLRQEAGAA